jgi:hypothetical protein
MPGNASRDNKKKVNRGKAIFEIRDQPSIKYGVESGRRGREGGKKRRKRVVEGSCR